MVIENDTSKSRSNASTKSPLKTVYRVLHVDDELNQLDFVMTFFRVNGSDDKR